MAKAAKPKADAKAKAKAKAKPKLADKDQSERFMEAARELGADASRDDFEQVIRKILLPKTRL